MKRDDVIKIVVVALCGIFAATISLYHVTYDKVLKELWIFADNGLPLVLSLYISYLSVGFLKLFFRWVLPPYLITKMIYHLSCTLNVYIISADWWENLWSGIAVSVLVSGLIYCLILHSQKNE